MKSLLRFCLSCCVFLLPILAFGQVGNNLILLGNWDNPNLPVNSGLVYNEVWGWHDGNGREYGIIGSMERSYFIEVTNPAIPVVVDSVEGTYNQCIHRDYKTYGQYCYAVADEGASTLQVIDMSYLPDSVHVVFNSAQFFQRCHNTFIDTASGLLYAVGTNTQSNGVIILDIGTNPALPTLVASHNLGVYTHDLYVRNDTAYMNNGPSGLAVVDFSNPLSPQLIGALGSYPQQGYNHSCWLTESGNHLVMCDETWNISSKMVDVSNLNNIGITSMFRSRLLFPDTASIPHNPLVAGNYVTVSYYHDGVQIWDISNPANPLHVAGYDTEPNNTNYNGYKGCWGVYPFLPSGTILASDVLNGLFTFRVPFPFPRPLQPNLSIQSSTCNANGSAAVVPGGGTGPYSFAWSTGDTTSNISGLAPGSYSVTVHDRYGYASSESFTISGPPSLQLSLLVTNEFCSGSANGAIDLTVTGGTPGYSYQWSTGDQIQDINGLTTGWYHVTVTDTLGCSSSDSAFVNFMAQSPVAEAGQDSFLCSNAATLWATNPSLGTGQWMVVQGSGVLAGANTPNASVTGLSAGQNKLLWVVTSGQCTQADTLVLNVSTAAFVFAGPDTSLCGTNFVLNGSSPGFGLNFWSSPNPGVNFLSLSDPQSTVTGFQPGNYQIVWNVQELNCQGSDTFQLQVGFLPLAAFSQSVTGLVATFTDNSQFANAWFWDFGDGNTSSQQNPSHSYANNGLYNVCLVATDSCGSDTSCQQVNIFITGNDLALANSWQAFPNPFQTLLQLRWQQGTAEFGKLEVFDLGGRMVKSADWYMAQEPEMQLDLDQLPDGLYFLRLTLEDGRQDLRKLLKSR